MIDPSPGPRSGGTRFARRGSARLAYETAGPPAASGPTVPLVLLHDLLDDRSGFAAVRGAISGSADAVPPLVLPDARGHGASAALANRRITLPDLAADALAILDAEAISRAHLVGHGLGAATAFALAAAAPTRVASLILVDPSPVTFGGAVDPAARALREALKAAADAADKGLTDRALDALLDPRWGAGWRDRLPRPRLAAVRRHAGALAPLLTALAAYAPTDGGVGGVLAPTLVVHAANAQTAARRTAERLAALLPVARLTTIPPGPETALPLGDEAGAALAALVLAFVVDAERRPGAGPSPLPRPEAGGGGTG